MCQYEARFLSQHTAASISVSAVLSMFLCLNHRRIMPAPILQFWYWISNMIYSGGGCAHDDVIKWKHFPRNWPFVRGIHRSPVNSQHKGQGCGTLMFSLICAWINRWVNNGEAGDLRRIRPHYDVTVMGDKHFCCTYIWNRPHSPLGLSLMALMPTLFPCNTPDPLSLGLGRQFSTIRYIWPISFVIVNCVYGCKYKQNNFNWDESTLIQMRLYVNN